MGSSILKSKHIMLICVGFTSDLSKLISIKAVTSLTPRPASPYLAPGRHSGDSWCGRSSCLGQWCHHNERHVPSYGTRRYSLALVGWSLDFVGSSDCRNRPASWMTRDTWRNDNVLSMLKRRSYSLRKNSVMIKSFISYIEPLTLSRRVTRKYTYE